MAISTFLSIFFITLISVQATKPSRNEVYKKIDNGKDLTLYIFEPKKKLEHRACVVFFFGGGWVGGSPSQFYQQADRLAKLGVLAICADYRTKKSHGTSPIEAVQDARSAILWVRTNAKKLGIDPNKIVASGGSAGGHLAAMTGLQFGLERASELNSIPNAMVLFNPVLDTTDKGYGAEKYSKDHMKYSPCHLVQSGVCPTLLFHGTADKTVPFENATRFENLMKKAGNDCTLIAYKNEGHGFFNGKFFRPKSSNKNFEKTMKAMEAFLHRLRYIPKK